MKKTYKQRIDQSRWRKREASIFIYFIETTEDHHYSHLFLFRSKPHHETSHSVFFSFATFEDVTDRQSSFQPRHASRKLKHSQNLETGSIQLVPLSQQESSKPLKQIVTYFAVYLIQPQYRRKQSCIATIEPIIFHHNP